MKITLTFQRVFGKQSDDAGLFSISKTCIPDVVLEVERGTVRKTIIFDAKYRASRDSIHAALSDMHVYRDAIRKSADEPGIHAAFIVTPAHHADLQRYYNEDYRHEYRFGAYDLSPRNDSQFNTLVSAMRDLICNDG